MTFNKSQVEMKRIVSLGVIAAFFFSSTFAINKWLNIKEGGHWYWTACLRYIYVFIFLSLFTVFFNGPRIYKEIIHCFISYWYFWVVAGGIGFGLFYMSLCYAASYSAGWVLATTWQVTILMTPVVIVFLGSKIESRGVIYLPFLFTGVVLVNYEEFSTMSGIDIKSVIPISFAALCYPFGNTICKYACEGRYPKIPINKFSFSQNVFSQILLMTLGALPILILVGVAVSPPHPTISQIYSTAFIAMSTGVIGTSLLYKARQLAKSNSSALSAADGTQAAEAPLALFWEWFLFGGALPSKIGFLGLWLVVAGITLFYKSKIIITPNKKI